MHRSTPDRNTNETVRVVLFLTVYLTICNTVAQFMRVAYQDPMWIIYVLAGCVSAIIYDTYKRKILSNRAISVLLIEDSELIQQEIKDQFFESVLYQEFVVANTGQKALDMLKDGHRPDLILVDLTLPDMKGQQILDFLHHSNDLRISTIPTVIFTAPKNVEDGLVIGTNSTVWVQKRDLRSGELIAAVKVLVPSALKKEQVEATAMMDVSAKGIEVVKHYEKCPTSNGKCYLYRDGTGPHPGGVLTIGYGHVVAESNAEHYKNGITIEQAILLLHDDLARFVHSANRLIKVHTKANEFDACVSLIFNNGELPLHQHLGQYLNQQRYEDAAQQFQLWCNAEVHGRMGPVEGLFYRRLTETLLFLTGEVLFAHNWTAAQPVIKKIQTYFSTRGKPCAVPHYSQAQFIG